ncbi:hypothetical protein [Lactonifactor longoviformis]|uniref:ScoMcrA-like SRA domain-containing protein n=1 Tax=Lactonifactor longoviformis DSM 17459 TaxID=1122155 RepID=A0A1M4TTZ9_9CLOT|nr:hypothetical protein [Lactonifactor longoviformis]SHE47922.1 hypothetical protein SAMN02745158_00585 [Lactonifactor longoviformis DSM 17459]
MRIADILNIKVKHKVFGIGIITEVSDNHLTINFAAKESKFIYPDAFEQFIEAEDSSVQAEIMKEVNNKKLAAKMQQQAAEEARKTEEERHITDGQTVLVKRNRKGIEDGFGPDYNVRHLARQPVLTYQQVEEQFGIKIAGFGRGINRTSSTVVLISSVDKKKAGFVYHDHWTSDGDYMYSGEGKTGHQQMTIGNRAIVDAERDGKIIHLFVKFSPQEYYYQGVFSLVNYTYEDDKDESGNVRKEYKFRLRKQHLEE